MKGKTPKAKFRCGDKVQEISFPGSSSTVNKVLYILGMWHYWYEETLGWNTEYEIERVD